MPSTSIASISSRILRDAQVGADRRAAGTGDQQRGDDRAGLAQDGEHAGRAGEDCAPNCWVSVPSWSAMTAPKGIDDQRGRQDRHAGDEPRLVDELLALERAAGQRPDDVEEQREQAAGRAQGRRRRERSRRHRRDAGRGRRTNREAARPRWRGTTPPAGAGSPRRPVAGGRAAAGSAAAAAARCRAPRRQLLGVLLLGHADRADPLGVEELPDHRLLAGQQHLPRPEHGQVPVVEQPDVVGHGPGGVDVVGDDQERRAGSER